MQDRRPSAESSLAWCDHRMAESVLVRRYHAGSRNRSGFTSLAPVGLVAKEGLPDCVSWY